MRSRDVIIATRTCVICGKEFVPLYKANWKYRLRVQNRVKWFCSYTCYKEGKTLYEQTIPDAPRQACRSNRGKQSAVTDFGESAARIGGTESGASPAEEKTETLCAQDSAEI